MSVLKRNILYQTAYQILAIILPLITSPYISRVLGAENLGSYSYTYAIANYFVLFAMLGINNYGNRAIAVARNDKAKLDLTFSSIFLLHAIISLMVTGFYLFFSLLHSDNNVLLLIQSLYVISSVFDINWLYFGLEKFKLTVSRNALVKLITVAMIFIFVRTQGDVYKYALIMAFGTLLSQLTVIFFVPKFVTFQSVSIKDLTPHIKPMIIMFMPVIAISIYKIMDKIMLGVMSSKAQVGFYSNAERAINIPVSIIGAFGTVMLPRMANMLKYGTTKRSKELFDNSIRYIMLLTFALAFGMASVSDIFSVVFWGREFRECGNIILCLSITVPFLALANIVRTQLLIPLNKDKEYTISVIAGAVVNVIINYIMIPKFHALGAAYGTVLAEATVCVLQIYFMRDEFDIRKYLKDFITYIFIGTVMYIIVRLMAKSLAQNALSLLACISAGGVIFCIMTLVFLLYSKDELILNFIHKMR